MKIFFSQKCLGYSQPGHPESPLRVSTSYEFLKEKGFDFKEPRECSEEDILLVHSKKLLDEVKSENFQDMDTPALDKIYYYAKLAVGSAIEAALSSLKGEKAFSLMRPPGHHATRDNLGGFCYFNNIAIASMKAKELVERIAIIDLDCHHGNGTQDIFLGKKDIIYVSLHQSPLYPGTGLRSELNCFNYPLASNTTSDSYIAILDKALTNVEEFNPDLLAISMGFDTYEFDPITSLSIDKEAYKIMGERIAGLGKPVFCVLEGGYNYKDIPECLFEFICGLK
ncbi:MAG: histone deacetylase [Candidatus Omnitrophota bacterium]